MQGVGNCSFQRQEGRKGHFKNISLKLFFQRGEAAAFGVNTNQQHLEERGLHLGTEALISTSYKTVQGLLYPDNIDLVFDLATQ